MSVIKCDQNFENINNSGCSINYGQIVGFLFDETATAVTSANALLEATWTAKLQAVEGSRAYKLLPKYPNRITFEPGEVVFTESNTNNEEYVRSGRPKLIFEMDNLKYEYWNALKSFNGSSGFAWLYTVQNFWIARRDGTTGFKPIKCRVYVPSAMAAENADGTWKQEVHLTLLDTEDWASKAYEVTAFTISELEGIIDVTGSVFSSSAAGKVVVVDMTKLLDGTEIVSGFVTAADFALELVSTSAVQYFDTISNVGNRWTLTLAGAGTMTAAEHYIYRKPADTATDKSFEWKRDNKVTFTASA
jgi:hypothetical protein